MPRLTETEKQEVLRFLQADKPLPEKYRFLLFDDKREVELVWNGKTSEVCNIVLPFQTIEQVDEPRAEGDKAKKQPQGLLFDLDARGRQLKGWTNKLIWGDNKLILSSLKNGPLRDEIERQGGLKLIYIDPPFDVGADFSMDIEIGDGGDTFTKRPNILEEIAYRDTWGKGADSFISMIYERLILMRDLLAEDGSIYLHCDPRVTALIRLAMDEVFGSSKFQNEIIWKRQSAHSDSHRYGPIHDIIHFYSKSDRFIFSSQYEPLSEDYIDAFFTNVDENGRRFSRGDLTAPGPRPNLEYEWRGYFPTRGRCWAVPREKLDEYFSQGRIFFPKSGVPRLKRYPEDSPGVLLQDLWTNVKIIHNQSIERISYPTQKPEALIDRIIRVSSNPDDLVADFFCGSGTTAAVAEKLGRKWIATDLGKFAIHTTRKRMIGVQRQLKSEGKDYRAFEILNLGRYERQHYVANVKGGGGGREPAGRRAA